MEFAFELFDPQLEMRDQRRAVRKLRPRIGRFSLRAGRFGLRVGRFGLQIRSLHPRQVAFGFDQQPRFAFGLQRRQRGGEIGGKNARA